MPRGKKGAKKRNKKSETQSPATNIAAEAAEVSIDSNAVAGSSNLEAAATPKLGQSHESTGLFNKSDKESSPTATSSSDSPDATVSDVVSTTPIPKKDEKFAAMEEQQSDKESGTTAEAAGLSQLREVVESSSVDSLTKEQPTDEESISTGDASSAGAKAPLREVDPLTGDPISSEPPTPREMSSDSYTGIPTECFGPLRIRDDDNADATTIVEPSPDPEDMPYPAPPLRPAGIELLPVSQITTARLNRGIKYVCGKPPPPRPITCNYCEPGGELVTNIWLSGVLLAIFMFPIGILGLWFLRDTRCTHCGFIFNMSLN